MFCGLVLLLVKQTMSIKGQTTPLLCSDYVGTYADAPGRTVGIVAGDEIRRALAGASPDQSYGTRRSVTATDRAAIQSYRSGRKPPIFSTTIANPAERQADWDVMVDDNKKGDFLSCRPWPTIGTWSCRLSSAPSGR